jgi:FKBP-type peptidyl-prolyl cis-trans isomerase
MTMFLPGRRTGTLALGVLAALSVPACKTQGSGGSDPAGREGVAAAASGLPAPPDVAEPPDDARVTASGLASKILAPGTGAEHPDPNAVVRVNYTGWSSSDGKMIDSTFAPRKQGRAAAPVTLALGSAIAGWIEGIQLMVAGEKRRFWIPEKLAYKGRPGTAAGMVVFDIELLDFAAGPEAPANVAAAPPDAERTQDGLASKVTQRGSGTAHPQATDAVRVNYSIWQTDGKLVDASKDKPAVRPVTGFSDGWAEGLKLMVVGEKRTFWVPAALAFDGRSGATPRDVTMAVELLAIGPKSPPDVDAPPKDAIVEKDGLVTKVLAKGSGTVHPTPSSRVTVQYSGWTTDGNLFDSSYLRGEPTTFDVGSVIPGWTEAVQLMVEGEKRRIWIPEALAYKGQPQRPKGMLVFEVELLKIGDASRL